MKINRKKTPKEKRIEKICLISLSIVVLCILIAIYYFSIHGFLISKEWLFFVSICFLYNSIIIVCAYETGMIKEYKPVWISVLILILLANIPFIVLLFLELSGKSALPRYGSIYTFIIFIVFPSTVVIYDLILDKLNEWKKR